MWACSCSCSPPFLLCVTPSWAAGKEVWKRRLTCRQPQILGSHLFPDETDMALHHLTLLFGSLLTSSFLKVVHPHFLPYSTGLAWCVVWGPRSAFFVVVGLLRFCSCCFSPPSPPSALACAVFPAPLLAAVHQLNSINSWQLDYFSFFLLDSDIYSAVTFHHLLCKFN